MESHNIDSKIKKMISGSTGFFEAEANESKERIWQHIQLKEQKQDRHLWLRLIAAACILLFMATSVITVSNIRANKKIKSLTALNSSLREKVSATNESNSKLNKLLAQTNNAVPDTVYVEKKVPVPYPVVSTRRVTDTLYVERKVYVEKENPLKITAARDNRFPVDTISRPATDNYEARILIMNDNEIKPKKERKLKIRFSANRDQASQGSLALRAEL